MSNHMHNSNSATRLAAARRRMCAPLLLLVLAAPAALADSRADAKRHFREGMSLIAAGQVERGIAELKQAYAIKPHPDVLYDIAKAYVETGKIPEALSYFRQYVATDPVDKEQVLSVMQRLQALVNQQQTQAALSPAPAKAAGARKPEAKPAPPPAQTNPEDDMFEPATI